MPASPNPRRAPRTRVEAPAVVHDANHHALLLGGDADRDRRRRCVASGVGDRLVDDAQDGVLDLGATLTWSSTSTSSASPERSAFRKARSTTAVLSAEGLGLLRVKIVRRASVSAVSPARASRSSPPAFGARWARRRLWLTMNASSWASPSWISRASRRRSGSRASSTFVRPAAASSDREPSISSATAASSTASQRWTSARRARQRGPKWPVRREHQNRPGPPWKRGRPRGHRGDVAPAPASSSATISMSRESGTSARPLPAPRCRRRRREREPGDTMAPTRMGRLSGSRIRPRPSRPAARRRTPAASRPGTGIQVATAAGRPRPDE